MKKEKLKQLSLELGMKFDETSKLFTEETLNSMKLFSLVGEGCNFGVCTFGSCISIPNKLKKTVAQSSVATESTHYS